MSIRFLSKAECKALALLEVPSISMPIFDISDVACVYKGDEATSKVVDCRQPGDPNRLKGTVHDSCSADGKSLFTKSYISPEKHTLFPTVKSISTKDNEFRAKGRK